ncbi:hypothetical protein CA13_11470 [Planctomycetes bacterium CA13]|uniref:Uncharacterized protein n=1 Tax=Novipirellula herctigrandis TaxID=2527986 RepID=A0A5C5YXW8_9BACT|nr:hypothetical protein CA13_11470 [Planctomycetes bacterium CA13]
MTVRQISEDGHLGKFTQRVMSCFFHVIWLCLFVFIGFGLGVSVTGGAVPIEDLPITIEPSQTEWIRVSMYGRSESGPQRESAFLICDDSTSGLTLNVTALVHPNP